MPPKIPSMALSRNAAGLGAGIFPMCMKSFQQFGECFN